MEENLQILIKLLDAASVKCNKYAGTIFVSKFAVYNVRIHYMLPRRISQNNQSFYYNRSFSLKIDFNFVC